MYKNIYIITHMLKNQFINYYYSNVTNNIIKNYITLNIFMDLF